MPETEIEVPARQVQTTVAFSGPLPPPALFADYEQACPGAAGRILAMAEKEQAHRHEQEAVMVREAASSVRRGQIFACGIACLGLVIAALVAIFGNGWTATVLAAIIGAGGFAPIVIAFLQSPEEAGKE